MDKNKKKSLKVSSVLHYYSRNKINTKQIQISCQNWNDSFSSISHYIILLLIPIVSKEQVIWIQESQEIDIKFTITEGSNFDNQCSSAHFVSFLFYFYCTLENYVYLLHLQSSTSTLKFCPLHLFQHSTQV